MQDCKLYLKDLYIKKPEIEYEVLSRSFSNVSNKETATKRKLCRESYFYVFINNIFDTFCLINRLENVFLLDGNDRVNSEMFKCHSIRSVLIHVKCEIVDSFHCRLNDEKHDFCLKQCDPFRTS